MIRRFIELKQAAAFHMAINCYRRWQMLRAMMLAGIHAF